MSVAQAKEADSGAAAEFFALAWLKAARCSKSRCSVKSNRQELNMNRIPLLRGLLLTTILFLARSQVAQAAQSYDNCTGFITSIPAVLATQGTWCLKQDLATAMTSGNAITINTNNVTIDCNDFKLGGLAAGPGTSANGIYALDRLNGTVRNCNIRGFKIGLAFQASSSSSSSGGYLVEDNRFDGNTYIGLLVEGDGSIVQRNRVFDTGGGTGIVSVFALATTYAVDILNNSVSGVAATTGGNGNVLGIVSQGSPYGRIIGNGVTGLTKDGTGQAYGIYASFLTPVRLAIHDNDIVGDGTGIGLFCANATDRARDNNVGAFSTGISGCSDDGGNVISP